MSQKVDKIIEKYIMDQTRRNSLIVDKIIVLSPNEFSYKEKFLRTDIYFFLVTNDIILKNQIYEIS